MKRIFQNTVLLALLTSFAFGASAQSMMTAKQPEVTVKRVYFADWVGRQLHLRIVFHTKNTNDFPIDISAVRYTLMVNNYQLAKDWLEQEMHLPANATTEVSIPVTANVDALANLMPEVLISSVLRYQLDGAVVVKDFPLHIPFQYAGDLLLPR